MTLRKIKNKIKNEYYHFRKKHKKTARTLAIVFVIVPALYKGVKELHEIFEIGQSIGQSQPPADNSDQISEKLKNDAERSVDRLYILIEKFDNGEEGVAAEMASIIKNLLYSTKNEPRYEFRSMISYCNPPQQGNWLPYHGLIGFKIEKKSFRSMKGYYTPNFRMTEKNGYLIPFELWWNQIVFDNKNGIQSSRKQIILSIAFFKGGEAMSNFEPEDFKKLRKKNFLGWKVGSNFLEGPLINSQTEKPIIEDENFEDSGFQNKPEFVAVRVVAEEVIQSYLNMQFN